MEKSCNQNQFLLNVLTLFGSIEVVKWLKCGIKLADICSLNAHKHTLIIYWIVNGHWIGLANVRVDVDRHRNGFLLVSISLKFTTATFISICVFINQISCFETTLAHKDVWNDGYTIWRNRQIWRIICWNYHQKLCTDFTVQWLSKLKWKQKQKKNIPLECFLLPTPTHIHWRAINGFEMFKPQFEYAFLFPAHKLVQISNIICLLPTNHFPNNYRRRTESSRFFFSAALRFDDYYDQWCSSNKNCIRFESFGGNVSCCIGT